MKETTTQKAEEKKEEIKTETKETETVTEEQLLKSLQDLEGKKEEKTEEKKPVIETVSLTKSAEETIEANASDELKKAIEISDVMAEFSSLIGLHVDTSLEELAKSITAGRERDLAVIQVITEMKKSIDELKTQIQEFGKEPGKPVSKTSTETTKAEVLEKSTVTDSQKKELGRPQIQAGLEELAKSAKNDQDRDRHINAAVKFETTGQIEDAELQKAVGAYKRLSAAA